MNTGKTGGSWSLGGLVQFWGVLQERQHYKLAGVTTPRQQNFFMRIRRADFRLKGEIIPKTVSFAVSIDPSKTFNLVNNQPVLVPPADAPATGNATNNTGATGGFDSNDRSPLQDFYLTLQSDYLDFVVGQFKTPISMEANWSSGKLLFPERGMVSSVAGSAARGIGAAYRGYGDNRELAAKVEKKIADIFYYSVGVYNGPNVNGGKGQAYLITRQNQLTDDDLSKDLGVRLEAYPVQGLAVGVASYDTIGRAKHGHTVDILNADLHYEANNFYAHHEYIHAWTRPTTTATTTTKAIEGQGYSGSIGYTIAKHIQPAVRFGWLNPNIRVQRNAVFQYEGGLNWLLQGNDYKIQLDVAVYDPLAHGVKPTTQAIMAVQGAF